MRVVIEIDIDDEFLRGRVAEFNRDSDDDEQTTPERYVRGVVRDLLIEDALPVTLFRWPLEARIASVSWPLEGGGTASVGQ